MRRILILFGVFILFSCQNKTDQLPYLGNHTEGVVNGKMQIKKYFTIPDFKFRNQDSIVITNKTFEDKIYIADFIFLSCPTICPVMNHEMKRVYDVFKDNASVVFVSHTVDPENDQIPVLKSYAQNLDVDGNKWHFLHGTQQEILQIAEKGYFTQAYADVSAPGGYAHSAGFILVDKNRHIRGVYDGTNSKDVDRLIKDIVILLEEKSV